MQTTKYTRKTFDVDAVQVTAENMAEVAEWCSGKLGQDDKDQAFIKVKIHRPLSERQTRAYVGDWVLFAQNGFKVYTPKAFENGFVLVPTEDAPQVIVGEVNTDKIETDGITQGAISADTVTDGQL